MIFKIIYSLTLIITIKLINSTKNWIITWLMMEINLMSFIPTMMNKKNNFKMNYLNLINYFMIQCMSSILFLFSNLMIMFNLNMFINNLMNTILLMSIMIKLGMFPFYSWYLKLMINMNWILCFMLSTIQKIIPLILIMNLMYTNYNLILFLIMNNSIFSTIMGINQTMLKSLMTYSSMNHLSWMIISLFIEEKMFFLYFLIYTLINFPVMFYLNMTNLNSINETYNKNINLNTKIMFLISMLTLSSLPPLMGFLLKWNTTLIMKMNLLLTTNMIILLITATMTTYYYLMLIMPSLTMNNFMKKMINSLNTYFKSKMWLSLISFMMIFLLMFNKIIYY